MTKIEKHNVPVSPAHRMLGRDLLPRRVPWTAVAERSGDTAFASAGAKRTNEILRPRQSGVALRFQPQSNTYSSANRAAPLHGPSIRHSSFVIQVKPHDLPT